MKPSPPKTPVLSLIVPAAQEGWQLVASSGETRQYPTLEEATVPGNAQVTLALPSRLVILERLTLPSTDREELDGMVLLQLEKTLPYPVEETLYGFEILQQSTREGEDGAAVQESTVVACAIHAPALDTLVAPLLAKKLYPSRLTLWGVVLATRLPKECTVGAIWLENEQAVFGIFENGVLTFVEVLGASESIETSLPHLLLSAELAGTNTTFAQVLLDPILADLKEVVRRHTGCSVELLSTSGITAESVQQAGVDLTPETWRAEVAKQERMQKLKRHTLTAVAVYAGLLLLGYSVLGIAKWRLGALDKEVTALRPQLDALLADQARWNVMAPAIDQRRYTLELLLQIFESLPSPDVRVTLLEQSPSQFRLDVEAPSASQAIAFSEALKARESLKEYRFEAAPPTILANDKAQIRIFGKL